MKHHTTLKSEDIFGENIQLGPSTVKLIGYNYSPIKNLGSIIVFLYHGNVTYKVLCKAIDSSGHMILGRVQAPRMKYIDFPQTQVPAVNAKPKKTILAVQEEQVKAAAEPVRPLIQQSKDSGITITGKTQQLPITKEYLLKEYAVVFEGIGTLLCGEYHIQLKESYNPVQHPLRHGTISLKPGYRAEFDRLLKLGITKVREYTESINSIVPVKKSDGSLRLCLDPKDLNKNIKQMQWYSRTIDDIPLELPVPHSSPC